MESIRNLAFVALATGLGIAGAADAYTTLTSGDAIPEQVPVVEAEDDSIALAEDLEIRVDPTDLIVGRTVGFQVRLNLRNGPSGSVAEFAAPAAPVAGPDLPAGWSVSLGAAGAVGDDFLVVNVNPPGVAPVRGIVPGEIITIPGIVLQDVEELLIEGAIISGQTFFADPGSFGSLSREDVDLVQSGNPVLLGCDAAVGDVSKTIDVADTSATGGRESKTGFSLDGSLGGAAAMPAEADRFDFGDVFASSDPAFATFAYAPTDAFTTTVTGDAASRFDAFDAIFLSSDECTTNLVDGEIDNNVVRFEYSLDELGPAGTAAGYHLALCGQVDGATVIDAANPISVTTKFKRPGSTMDRSTSCNMLPLRYNGTVVEVHHVNPVNPTAQTFLRVVNRSGTGGWVRMDGIDDAGNGALLDGSHRVRFFLPAHQSAQFNSADLELGNPGKGLEGAWGEGTGKWRAVVTAEFPGARVQAMSRNTIDGTVSNLTAADGRGSQARDAAADHGRTVP